MEPKIPTLKDSKKPQVKVRGLEAGVTLFDRLKQFKKKDLAFILAGLGTLFMAPLAEHFMMAPEGGDAALNAGFGGKGGKGGGLFDNSGNGSVGYDVSNGQAPGSAVGGGSDVITPLNVRDPSALVMGPGATQQPPTNSVAPATPPPTAPVTRSDSDLKDALAASARGVGGAAKAAKALLPVPKIALAGAGGLRGLGVANGGSSASSSLGPISSSGLASGKADTRGGMAGVKGGKDIKGVARGQSQGGGGLEALKAAANNAGDQMNRGPAQAALDQTAAQAIPNGGGSFGGGGQGGAGANDKAEGANGGKDNKSTGESLEFLKQKAMQEKKIELWAKEQEAGDNKLELLKLRNSMAEAIAGKVGGAIGDAVTCPMTKGFKKCYSAASDPGYMSCMSPDGKTILPNVDGDKIGKCGDDGIQYMKTGGATISLMPCSATTKDGSASTPTGQIYGTNCSDYTNGSGSSGSAAKTDPPGPGGVGRNGPQGPGLGGIPADSFSGLQNLAGACKSLEDIRSSADGAIANMKGQDPNSDAVKKWTDIKSYADGIYAEAANIAAKRDVLSQERTSECGADKILPDMKTPVIKDQNDIVSALSGEKGAIAAMIGAVSKNDAADVPYATIEKAEASLASARKSLDAELGVKVNAAKLGAEIPTAKLSSVYVGVPGGDAQANKLLAGIQQVRKANETLATLENTIKGVQERLDKEVPAVRRAAGKTKDDKSAPVVIVTGLNAKYDKELINHEVREEFADVLGKPEAPNYTKMNAKDAKPTGTGKEDSIDTATRSESAAKKAMDTYKDTEDATERANLKKPTGTSITTAKTTLGDAWQAQAGRLNQLDGAITADGLALSRGAVANPTVAAQ